MASGRVPETGHIVTTPGPLGTAGRPADVNLYVNNIGSDGWLQARERDSTSLVSLAKYTKMRRV